MGTVAALSCITICVQLLGYADASPSLDSSSCRCVDLVDKREVLPIPITLRWAPPKKAAATEEDARPEFKYDEDE